MRLIPALAGLIILAACVAVDPAAISTPTPALYSGPVATPTGARPGLAPPDANATLTGRLPQQAAVATPKLASLATYTLDAALRKKIEDVLGSEAEHYGVYVKNLATNRGAALNGDKVFNAASVFKIEVMYEAFRQRSLNLLKFDEQLQVTEYYAQFDLGTLRVPLGQSVSIEQALAFMMSVSDNVSAVLLQDRAGAGNINATLKALGLEVTGLFTEGLPATAEDFGLLLEAIAKSPDIDEESRKQMLDLLASETVDNGVKAGVPAGVRVAHKTGNWSDATNDAAIVFAPRGTYVLVVLSDNNHDSRGIKAVSEAVYQHFEQAR